MQTDQQLSVHPQTTQQYCSNIPLKDLLGKIAKIYYTPNFIFVHVLSARRSKKAPS
jgi:hypothetical protein